MGQRLDEPRLERARKAASRQAWEEAYGLLAEEDQDAGLDADTLPLLAQASYLSGRPDVAVAAWERVHAARLREGDPEAAADAAAQIAVLLLDAGMFSPLRGWVGRADELLRDRPGSPVHGALAVVLAWTWMLNGDLDRALAEARRAVEVGTRVGHAVTRAMGRHVQGRILILQGHVDEGLAVIDESAVAATAGELDPITTSILYCSTVCAFQGLAEYDRAEEWTRLLSHWIRDNPSGSFHGYCLVHRAEIKRLRGAWRDAEADARDACDHVRRYNRADVGWPLSEIGQIRLQMGDLAGAEEAFLAAHEHGWDPNPGLALLQLAKGDVEGAASTVRDALDNPPETPSLERPPNTDLRRAPLLAAEVEIAVAAGDPDRARSAAAELEQVASSYGSKALRASAAAATGAVLLADGDAARARGSYQAAVSHWTEIGAPYECARARIGLSAALRAAGNDQRATLELRAARSAFERLGATIDVRVAAEALAELGAGPPPDAPRATKVFLFTDIVRSTDLAEAIGDEAWTHLVRWHNDTLSRLVAQHRGEVVHTLGDGFFVTFDEPHDAVECAVAIQRALDAHRRDHGFSPRVRIGLHRAQASRDGSDWTGVGVHAAARIGALADGGEILASRGTAAAARTAYTLSEARTVTLRGISQPVEVVAVTWR